MSKQIFKKDIPKEILIDLLKSICVYNNNHYTFDKIAFKKAIFNNLFDNFLNNIKEYYQSSKKYYIERKLTYSSILTIIRHICKYNNITYISKIIYNNSSYEIIYKIYN